VQTLSEPAREITVEVDGLLLERVIVNLVDNALKFTPVDGEIEIRLEDRADRIEVSVRDTGRGIPTDSIEKLFHKFSQVPGTKGGTGLGLTIVKYIVEAHGGKVGVSSQPGKGTTFRFWVPKKPVQPEAARA
jgi:two-component system phosphate regulon sensor histidine kinase PhoR